MVFAQLNLSLVLLPLPLVVLPLAPALAVKFLPLPQVLHHLLAPLLLVQLSAMSQESMVIALTLVETSVAMRLLLLVLPVNLSLA